VPSTTFTDRWVKSVKPEPARTNWFDKKQRGLVLRVSPGGHKSWLAVYRVKGQRKLIWQTLGDYTTMTLAEARGEADKALRAAAKGRNPAQAEQERRAAPTVNEIAEAWFAQHVSGLRSAGEIERALRKDALPYLGDLKAASVHRRDVRAVVARVVERGAPVSANLLQAYLKSLFSWAVDHDLVPAHPFPRMRRPHRPSARDRVLSEAELRTLWGLLDNGHARTATGRAALKLVLATAQRPGEVAAASWDEFDLDTGWWTIPDGRSKNKLAHRVWLNSPARAVLEALPRKGPHLFPGRLSQDATYRTGTLSHAARRIRESKAGKALAHWTPHDLRRTAASLMTGAGIPRLTVKKILNHADPDITAVYDRHSYDAEKRRALETWGREMERIVAGEKGGEVVRIA